MKKILFISIPLILLLTLVIIFIPKKNNNEEVYASLYEASTLLTNITYDIDATWSYYLKDENFNRTDLTKIISLKEKDMINDTCNLIYTKKIDVILDCITTSHQKNYDHAKKIIKEANTNDKDLKTYSKYLDEYIEISKYHGENYNEYNAKIKKIKDKIDTIEAKLNKIYTVESNNSL